MADPTREQRAVIAATENLVVIGRPGSGKTTTGLWKAERRGSDPSLTDHQCVLFLSFSRGATERIAAASRIDMTATARRRLRVATYHSLCHELLRSHCTLAAIRHPLRLLLPEDARIIENELGHDAAGREFERLERDESRVAFDRFAPLAVDLLQRSPRLRAAYSSAYPLILVDEYQDTDDFQDEFVRLLGEHSQIVCFGDPDQRIYDYRPGVRPDRLARLETVYGFRRIELASQNHRNRQSGIREVAQSVLSGTWRPSRAITVLTTGNQRTSMVKKICEAITILRANAARDGWASEGGPSICVMLPTNDLVRDVSAALRGMPEEDRRRFRHDVVVDLDELSLAWDVCLLALEHGSGASGHPGTAEVILSLARHHRYLGTKGGLATAKKLEAWAAQVSAGEFPRSPFVDQLQRAVEAGRVCSGEPIADITAVRDRLRAISVAHARASVELLDLRLPGTGNVKLRDELTQTFSSDGHYRGAASLGRQHLLVERLLDAGSTQARLRLMTMHRCKGGEFDAVVLAECPGGTNRFLRSARQGEDASELEHRGRRLFHVALTRAKHRAFVITPAYDRSPLLS